METRTERVPFAAPERFHGPEGLANGGWLAGSLASFFPGGTAVEVTLRAPTPVDTPLSIESGDGRVRLLDGETVLAEAVLANASPLAAPPVDWGAAGLAETNWTGWWEHPLPTCFVCGHRSIGDGLRIFPGPVEGRPGTVASRWTPGPDLAGPDGVVPAEYVWGALDCPTGWPHIRPGGVALLGRIVARVPGTVVAGEDYLVVGRVAGVDGRKLYGQAGVYDRDGAVVGASIGTWITLN
jgi:hypothetical protein